jgi:hypothetical protein
MTPTECSNENFSIISLDYCFVCKNKTTQFYFTRHGYRFCSSNCLEEYLKNYNYYLGRLNDR